MSLETAKLIRTSALNNTDRSAYLDWELNSNIWHTADGVIAFPFSTWYSALSNVFSQKQVWAETLCSSLNIAVISYKNTEEATKIFLLIVNHWLNKLYFGRVFSLVEADCFISKIYVCNVVVQNNIKNLISVCTVLELKTTVTMKTSFSLKLFLKTKWWFLLYM